jgi:hypothetical protein
MIENNTPKPKDSDSERILDKISKVVNELSFTDDSLTLIENMISLNVLLSTEIRHFNLFKSSDSLMVYARVLDAKLPSFNENVSLVLHYNQALLDLQDDWEDIEDDVQEDMPNVFVMAAITDVTYDRIKSSPHERIRNVVLDELGSSHSSIIRLVDEYQASVRGICIPDNLVFLKSLSDHYADTLKGTISSSVDSQIRSDS